MNANELCSLQAPIKQQYRDDPAAALIPARAVGEVGRDAITCSVEQRGCGPACRCRRRRHDEMLRRHAARGAGPPARAGVTLKSVATALGVEMRSAKVIADGHWDARGTLGVSREVPVGLTDVTLTFEIDSDADAAKLDKLIRLTERYCVIYQTLKQPPGDDSFAGDSAAPAYALAGAATGTDAPCSRALRSRIRTPR